jgi:hypothetical protein
MNPILMAYALLAMATIIEKNTKIIIIDNLRRF